jgi:hypothetical protein
MFNKQSFILNWQYLGLILLAYNSVPHEYDKKQEVGLRL